MSCGWQSVRRAASDLGSVLDINLQLDRDAVQEITDPLLRLKSRRSALVPI